MEWKKRRGKEHRQIEEKNVGKNEKQKTKKKSKKQRKKRRQKTRMTERPGCNVRRHGDIP